MLLVVSFGVTGQGMGERAGTGGDFFGKLLVVESFGAYLGDNGAEEIEPGEQAPEGRQDISKPTSI